jgi:PAS domain S-box-containing protein
MDAIPTSIEQRFRLLVEAIEDYAIFILDPTGHIVTWNTGAQKIKGYKANEIIGKHVSVFYAPDAIATGWPDEELRRAAALGRFEDEGWRLRKDGTRFWANVVITRLLAPDGSLQGFAKVTRDLSERKRHEQDLQESEERFRLLIDNVRDYMICMLGPDGTVQSWNGGAQLIMGYRADEIIGKHFGTFFPRSDAALNKPACELAAAYERGRVEEEAWRVRKDGSMFWANVVVTAVFDNDGKLRGYAKVVRDMTDRHRLEQLEKSSRRINEFLAMLGHELRNPLAPIRNSVSILQLEALTSPTIKGARDMIDRQLTHLTRLVDDLLDVGRVTTGKIALQKEIVAIGDVVQRSVEASRGMIDSRAHFLSLDVPSEPLFVNGDVTRLTQVFQNLLNNAAKFTPKGGHISVSVVEDEGTIVVRVRDTGIGISADATANIFDLFAQETERINPSESGLGIGLTVARSIVEMHGGTIEVSSEGEDKGAEFTVRLPTSRAKPAERDAPETTRPPITSRLRVLVVDDNRDAAESLALLVRMMGHDARHVYDGASAIVLAKEFQPHVALLDLAMPRTNGFDLQKQLRAIDTSRPMTIAAITGLGQTQTRRRALDAGFDQFMVKPVAIQNLVELFGQVPRP